MSQATHPGTDDAPRAGARPAQRRWAVALTSVSFFMVALDSLVVITALPAIRVGLHGSSMATADQAPG
jgi:hypothetical protein